MSNENDLKVLEQAAKFGMEAEDFIKSPIGQYLLNRSLEEIDNAFKELKAVNPHDYQRVQELQNTIKRNESVELWLGEIIATGKEAMSMLKDEL